MQWILVNENNQPIENSLITLKNDTGNIIATHTTNAKGEYYLNQFLEDQDYVVEFSLEGYESQKITLSNIVTNTSTSLPEITLIKSPEIPGANNTTLSFDPVYFDLDSSVLISATIKKLNDMVETLKQHPEVELEILSHTDSRAGNEYNLWLSKRRSNKIYNYLISKGINANRLSFKSLGESALVNECADNVDCTEEKHRLNRRSEFVIVKQ